VVSFRRSADAGSRSNPLALGRRPFPLLRTPDVGLVTFVYRGETCQE